MSDNDSIIEVMGDFVYLTDPYYLEFLFDLGNKHYYRIIVGLN